MSETETITINLNTATRSQIEKFMVKHSLYSCADIGRFVGLSRERVRQIFATRPDLDFKEIKSKLIKKQYEDLTENDKNLNWKQITFVNTKYPYYVSECGKVARDIERKKKGISIVERKLLKASANKNKHLRVNLTINLENDKVAHRTYYLHQIVARTWLEEPAAHRPLKGVRCIDGNLENCHVSNLEWSYFK